MAYRFGFLSLMAIATPAVAQDLAPAPTEAIPDSRRDDGIKCKPGGRSVTEISVQAAYNDFKTADATIGSLGVAQRFCQKDAPILWTIGGAVDRVRSGGRTTTAGRFGGGILYRAHATQESESGLYSSVLLGANAYLGYEDYDLDLPISGGGVVRKRGSRFTKVFEVVGAYTLVNLSDKVKFPTSFSAIKVETRALYVDKRTSAVNLPVQLNEGYFDASAAMAFDQFLDWGNGVKLEYRATYERFFTDRFAVRGFTTLRLQVRPQGNADIEYPDRFAISIAYSFAKRFSGLNLSISKVF